MEEVNITEHEACFYLDLFSRCDIEKTGKVPILKATEMFRSTDIDDDVLKHVGVLAFLALFESCLLIVVFSSRSMPTLMSQL